MSANVQASCQAKSTNSDDAHDIRVRALPPTTKSILRRIASFASSHQIQKDEIRIESDGCPDVSEDIVSRCPNTYHRGSPTTTSQKYIPRFKRDANAIPSIRLYTQRDIAAAIPGEGNHTFNRVFAPTNDEAEAIAEPEPNIEDGAEPALASDEQPQRALGDEFCRIMVHDKAHLSPPKELWTRHNIAQLDANVGRPIPLFQESGARKHYFEFLGWFRIARWELCPGGSKAVQDFVTRRKVSQVDKPREYWNGVLNQDWARVELEKVKDAALRNPMENHQ